jgi:hypothetical protein
MVTKLTVSPSTTASSRPLGGAFENVVIRMYIVTGRRCSWTLKFQHRDEMNDCLDLCCISTYQYSA